MPSLPLFVPVDSAAVAPPANHHIEANTVKAGTTDTVPIRNPYRVAAKGAKNRTYKTILKERGDSHIKEIGIGLHSLQCKYSS